jgi:hypothetical protein
MKTPHAHIEVAAYFLWLKAGRPRGRDLHFWLEAEFRLEHERHRHRLHEHVKC